MVTAEQNSGNELPQATELKTVKKRAKKEPKQPRVISSEFNPMEFDLSVTEADTFVFDTLLDNKNVLPRNGASIKTIVANMGEKPLAEVTIYNILQKYKEDGYIKEGIKSGRAKTYYISDKGILLYSHLFGISQSTKEALTKSMIDTNTCFTEENEIDYEAIANEVLNKRR